MNVRHILCRRVPLHLRTGDAVCRCWRVEVVGGIDEGLTSTWKHAFRASRAPSSEDITASVMHRKAEFLYRGAERHRKENSCIIVEDGTRIITARSGSQRELASAWRGRSSKRTNKPSSQREYDKHERVHLPYHDNDTLMLNKETYLTL